MIPAPANSRRISLALLAGLAASMAALVLGLRFAGPASDGFNALTGAFGLDRSARWHIAAEMAMQIGILALIGAGAYGAVMAAGPGRRLRPVRLLLMMAGMVTITVVILAACTVLHLLGPVPVVAIALAYVIYGFAMGEWVVQRGVAA